MPVQTQIQVRRGTASSWTSTNPTLAAGEIGFETDTGKIKVGTGSSTWSALNYIGAANAIQYVYTASAGQTTFSGADNNSLTLSYTVGAQQVFVNGVLQVSGTDYTATNGTSITLTTATIASDIVTIVAFGTFSIVDTYTQAQANATFPLNSIDKSAGKNKIINGDFGVWQRGTSFSGVGNTVYTADRWITETGGTANVTQQTFTPGTAPVAGYEGSYYLQYATATTNGTHGIDQRIEDVRTFAGQTVTISAWMKANSATTITVIPTQNFGSGGSTSVDASSTTWSLTTSWQRFTYTVAIPSVSGKTIGTSSYLNLRFLNLTNTSFTFQIWGVQLEAGSVATAFQTATGTIQGELAACQRYYYRTGVGTGATTPRAYEPLGYGSFSSSTSFGGQVEFPVSMRIATDTVEYSNVAVNDTASVIAATNVTVNQAGTKTSNLTITVASGGTQYRFARIINNNNTAGYLGWSAEL